MLGRPSKNQFCPKITHLQSKDFLSPDKDMHSYLHSNSKYNKNRFPLVFFSYFTNVQSKSVHNTVFISFDFFSKIFSNTMFHHPKENRIKGFQDLIHYIIIITHKYYVRSCNNFTYTRWYSKHEMLELKDKVYI